MPLFTWHRQCLLDLRRGSSDCKLEKLWQWQRGSKDNSLFVVSLMEASLRNQGKERQGEERRDDIRWRVRRCEMLMLCCVCNGLQKYCTNVDLSPSGQLNVSLGSRDLCFAVRSRKGKWRKRSQVTRWPQEPILCSRSPFISCHSSKHGCHRWSLLSATWCRRQDEESEPFIFVLLQL
jgi:hypothetical protein